MKTNLRKIMSAAIVPAMLMQYGTWIAQAQNTAQINYLLNDTFDVLEGVSAKPYFDSCGWSEGETSNADEYKVQTAWDKKGTTNLDMPYFTFTPGTQTPGEQPNMRKDLEKPINLKNGKVVIEARLAGDTPTGYNVNFELNRPKAASELADASASYVIFSLNNNGGGTVSLKNNTKGMTNYMDGPTGGRYFYTYAQPVTVKAVIDYSSNDIDYYVTYPDGTEYYRTSNSTLDGHVMKDSGVISSLALTTTGKGNNANQVNFWMDYVKIYQIIDTEATLSTDGRCDSTILVNFSNAELIEADLSDYCFLTDSNGERVLATVEYSNGTVAITPAEPLSEKQSYTVSFDKSGLSEIGVNLKTADLSFNTLASGEYLNDTLTKDDAAGWIGNEYALNFPSSHSAGGNSALLMSDQTGEVQPYSATKTLSNPIDITNGKVMIEANIRTDVNDNLNVKFNINDKTIFGTASQYHKEGGIFAAINVLSKNGLTNACNPAMTVGSGKEFDTGRPAVSFAEKINIKAILDYQTKTIKYYVSIGDGETLRTYTRDGWNDEGNMPDIKEITSLSFVASGAAKMNNGTYAKFWIDSVKISDVKQCTAEIAQCSKECVKVKFTGENADYSDYIELYNAADEKLSSEKIYDETEATVTVTPTEPLCAGEIYYIKLSPAAMASQTGAIYSGSVQKRFIPTDCGYELTSVAPNRGNGAYLRAKIKNNNDQSKTVMVVVTEKNTDGTLVSAKMDKQEIPAGEYKEFEANFISIDSQDIVEAYVWDAETLSPIIGKVIVTNID